MKKTTLALVVCTHSTGWLFNRPLRDNLMCSRSGTSGVIAVGFTLQRAACIFQKRAAPRTCCSSPLLPPVKSCRSREIRRRRVIDNDQFACYESGKTIIIRDRLVSKKNNSVARGSLVFMSGITGVTWSSDVDTSCTAYGVAQSEPGSI